MRCSKNLASSSYVSHPRVRAKHASPVLSKGENRLAAIYSMRTASVNCKYSRYSKYTKSAAAKRDYPLQNFRAALEDI